MQTLDGRFGPPPAAASTTLVVLDEVMDADHLSGQPTALALVQETPVSPSGSEALRAALQLGFRHGDHVQSLGVDLTALVFPGTSSAGANSAVCRFLDTIDGSHGSLWVGIASVKGPLGAPDLLLTLAQATLARARRGAPGTIECFGDMNPSRRLRSLR